MTRADHHISPPGCSDQPYTPPFAGSQTSRKHRSPVRCGPPDLEKNELPIPSRRNHAKFAPFLRLQQHSFDNIGKGICATVAARTRHCEWQRPRMRNFLGVRNLVIGYFARLSLSNSVLAGFRDATWVGDGRHPGGSWSRRVRIVGRDARNTVVYIENSNYYDHKLLRCCPSITAMIGAFIQRFSRNPPELCEFLPRRSETQVGLPLLELGSGGLAES